MTLELFSEATRPPCVAADTLLYSAGDRVALKVACRSARVGKLLPDALYVHTSALGILPAVLRVYEGCGRQLAGAIADATIVKLAWRSAAVSYLVYAGFNRVAHPALRECFVADLRRLRIHHRNYRLSSNPPILHRKELFVADDYPHRAKFQRLSTQEERAGLLAGDFIGRHVDWENHMARSGRQCRGHRLIPLTG